MNVTLRSLGDHGQSVAVPNRFQEITVGRGADCDLHVESLLVSRHHCKLIVRDECLYVRDLDSTNGTAVNGQRVIGERLLEDGDRLMVAAITFEVGIRPHRRLAARLRLVRRSIARALRVGWVKRFHARSSRRHKNSCPSNHAHAL